MFIGFVVLTLGALGVLSIVLGNPSPFASFEGTGDVEGLAEAGGLVGAVAAYPLSQVVSPAGAFMIDLGLAAHRALDPHRHVVRRGRPQAVGIQGDPGRSRMMTRSPPSDAKPRRSAGQGRGPTRRGAATGGSREPLAVPGRRGAGPAGPPHRRRPGEEDAPRGSSKRSGSSRSPSSCCPKPAPTPILASRPSPSRRPSPTQDVEGRATKPKTSKARTVTTSQGPYQLPPLDLLRRRAALDQRRHR